MPDGGSAWLAVMSPDRQALKVHGHDKCHGGHIQHLQPSGPQAGIHVTCTDVAKLLLQRMLVHQPHVATEGHTSAV